MYTISDYLLDILNYLNVKDILGVPGDYNLPFLDHITKRNDINWRGNMNELNAAYMADGYARKNGISAFVTTFGVGELSAINGFTGSNAERVPVLEIVGTPSTKIQAGHKLVHHSLGDGNFNRYTKAHQALGLSTFNITENNAVSVINDAVKHVIIKKRPAYLSFPVNLTELPINPIFKEHIPTLFSSKQNNSDFKLESVLVQQIENSKKPVLIIGEDIQRFGLENDIKKFITANHLPFSDLIESKGVIDESLPSFIGTYNGKLSKPLTNKVVDSSDLVIILGTVMSDSNMGGFTQTFTDEKTIDINCSRINFYSEIKNYDSDDDFTNVIKKISDLKLNNVKFDESESLSIPNMKKPTNELLTQSFYSQAMQNFIEAGDTIVVEQGTSNFALETLILPENVTFINQPIWSSIGYSFPAMLGSQLFNYDKRNILSIGEGSFLLTIQEMAFAFKNKLNPIIFILDNHGYTIERVIHGLHESYNDVPQLNYDLIPAAFGANKNQYLYFEAKTEQNLIDVMNKIKTIHNKLILVRVCLEETDVPEDLKKFGKIISDKNK